MYQTITQNYTPMGQIRSKNLYPVKEQPVMADYFIGSDSQTAAKRTVNFEMQGVADLFLAYFAEQLEIIGYQSRITAVGKVDRDGNTFTFRVGFQWLINNVEHANTQDIDITIDEAQEGFKRIDIAIVNSSNNIVLIKGEESEGIAVQPVTPPGTLFLCSWDIDGSNISDPSEPTIGAFVEKKEFGDIIVNLNSTQEVLNFDTQGRNTYRIRKEDDVAAISISGFVYDDLDTASKYANAPYNGKLLFIINETGLPVPLIHDDNTVAFRFNLKTSQNYTLAPNEIVMLRYQQVSIDDAVVRGRLEILPIPLAKDLSNPNDFESPSTQAVVDYVANILPDGLVSPGVVTWSGTGFEYNVSQAVIKVGGVLYTIPAGQITLEPSHPTLDRIDVVYATPSGFDKLTGTPASDPIQPQLENNEVFLITIIVQANTTEPIGITGDDIYKENQEWTGSSIGIGTIDFESETNPFEGQYAVETTNIVSGYRINFDAPANFDLNDIDSTSFRIRLKTNLNGAQNIQVYFRDENGIQLTGAYNVSLNKNLTNQYQLVSVEINQLNNLGNGTIARRIVLRYTFTNLNPYAGFFLDNWTLQSGIAQPQPITDFKVQDENGITQFTTDNLIKLKGVIFDAVNKVVEFDPATTRLPALNKSGNFSVATTDLFRQLYSTGNNTEIIIPDSYSGAASYFFRVSFAGTGTHTIEDVEGGEVYSFQQGDFVLCEKKFGSNGWIVKGVLTEAGVLGTIHNTIIGGVGATINTKALLAAQLTGVSESDISNFYLVGNDVYAQINRDYTATGNLGNALTRYIDYDGRFRVNFNSSNYFRPNITEWYVPNAVETQTFYLESNNSLVKITAGVVNILRTGGGVGIINSTTVEEIILDKLETISCNDSAIFTGLTSLKRIYWPRLRSILHNRAIGSSCLTGITDCESIDLPSLESITVGGTGAKNFFTSSATNLTRFYAPNLKVLQGSSISFTALKHAGCVVTVHSDLATSNAGQENEIIASIRAAGATIVYHQTDKWESADPAARAATSGNKLLDSTDNNRPTIHNGTEWKGLAYLDEINLQKVIEQGSVYDSGSDPKIEYDKVTGSLFLYFGGSYLVINPEESWIGYVNATNFLQKLDFSGVFLDADRTLNLPNEDGTLATRERFVNSPILDDPTHIVTVDEVGEELGRNILVSKDILNQTADDAVTVRDTTAETSLISPTFGTQTLDPLDMKAGQILNFEGFGFYSATAYDFDLRFKLGTQSVTVSMVVVGTASNLPWRFRGYVKFTGGADATRTFRFSGVVVRERASGELIEYTIPVMELTIDATTAQTFDITSQETDNANSITLNDSILTYGN